MSKLVRIKKHNGKTHVLKTYTVFGIKFDESKGWYEVDDDVAEYLASVKQVADGPDAEYSAPAFDIAESKQEALAIEEREKKIAQRRTADQANNAMRVNGRMRASRGASAGSNDLTSQEVTQFKQDVNLPPGLPRYAHDSTFKTQHPRPTAKQWDEEREDFEDLPGARLVRTGADGEPLLHNALTGEPDLDQVRRGRPAKPRGVVDASNKAHGEETYDQAEVDAENGVDEDQGEAGEHDEGLESEEGEGTEEGDDAKPSKRSSRRGGRRS